MNQPTTLGEQTPVVKIMPMLKNFALAALTALSMNGCSSTNNLTGDCPESFKSVDQFPNDPTSILGTGFCEEIICECPEGFKSVDQFPNDPTPILGTGFCQDQDSLDHVTPLECK